MICQLYIVNIMFIDVMEASKYRASADISS